MARRTRAGSTNLGDLLEQAAKENLQSDVVKHIHSSKLKKEQSKGAPSKNSGGEKSHYPIKTKGKMRSTSKKKSGVNRSVVGRTIPGSAETSGKQTSERQKKRRRKGALRRKAITFPPMVLLDGGRGAARKKGSAKEKIRTIDPLRWDKDTDLSGVFDEQSEEFTFRGASVEWKGYQQTGGNEVELVIGLDFGTTFTKVVVTESGSHRTWVVPLSSNHRNPFLLRSEVYLDGDVYNLDQKGELISGLKMPLLIGPADQVDINSVTAFLAVVVSYVQQWMLNEQKGFLRGAEPIWFLNVGLPAKDFKDHGLINRYRAISWAALLLASEAVEEISTPSVEQSYLDAKNRIFSVDAKLSNHSGTQVFLDQTRVFPEIMAQMAGFVRSRHWDESKPEFMLVDVGGGTLDQTIFNVVKDKTSGKLTFAVFKTSVEKMGTLRLHDVRLNWLLMKLGGEASAKRIIEKLRNLSKDLVSTWLVPDRIQDYLVNAGFGNYTIDHAFGSKVREDVMKRLRNVLVHINPGFRNARRRYPVILAGGGANNPCYQGMAESQAVIMGVKTELLKLPMPENLIAPGLSADLYHRVSVAYGLAFEDLGELLTPDKIKDLHISSHRAESSSGMVTKEQM